MRWIYSILCFFVLGTYTYAQQGLDSLIAPSSISLDQVEYLSLPLLNNEALLAAELERRSPGVAPRFAESIEVDVRPDQFGLWEFLPDGRAVWRLRITSPDAHSLNLGFTEYYMPPGGQMIIYDPDGTQILGPFSVADNDIHKQLWTPVFPGDELVLEVQLPTTAIASLRLRLTSVNHDFLGFLSIASGACNLDVICGTQDGFPIVDLYRDIIQSIAVIGRNGDTFCTGFLVNNTNYDCTPYFMTAYHCEINQYNASSVVAYWNYQNSECRQPESAASGDTGDGQLNNFNTGAIWRSASQQTDFTLLELDDPIPVSADAYFAGWSRSVNPPQDTLLCIHHPDGAEKRISIAYEDAHVGSWGGGSAEVPNGNHIIVPDWTIGSTESGSSGAPLFNSDKKVVGQLHGGAASCNNNSYDSFGWFRSSWNGGGTPQTRLRDWLDPIDANPLEIEGRWLSSCSATIELADNITEACSPGEALFYIEVSEFFANEVELSTDGLPLNSFATFTPNPAPPGSVANLSVILPGETPTGSILFSIIADDGTIETSVGANIQVNSGLPSSPLPQSPYNNEIGTSLAPVISWSALPNAFNYEIAIASDPSFENIIIQADNIMTNSFQSIPLDAYTTYFYRVRARNICGWGEWSGVRRFTTAATSCSVLPAEDLPKLIHEYANDYVTSTINISDAGTVGSIRLTNLDISHTYVGDLSAILQSPSGTIIELFHRPGVPINPYGCDQNNILVDFYDDAPLSSDLFENTCTSGNYAITGSYQPLESLSELIGEPITGPWKLTIIDHENQDGGQLNNWQLEICKAYPADTPEVFLTSVQGCSDTLNTYELFVGYGFQDSVLLNTYSVPGGVSMSFSSNPAPPGTYVTILVNDAEYALSSNFILTADDGVNMHICNIPLDIVEQPIAPALYTPDNESPVFLDDLLFSWTPITGIDTFIINIARDFAMTDIVHQAIVTDPFYNLFVPLEAGIYYWNVTSANRCGKEESETFLFYFEGTATNTEETEDEVTLNIFPNPASSQLQLRWDNKSSSLSQGILYNMNGMKVQDFSFYQSTVLDVHHLPAGLYLIKVENEGKIISQRIVVQH